MRCKAEAFLISWCNMQRQLFFLNNITIFQHPKRATLSKPMTRVKVLLTDQWQTEGVTTVVYNSSSKCDKLLRL